MATTRGVEIPIKITADTAGAKQTAQDLEAIKRQVMDMARANGMNEESVKKVGATYDQLATKLEKLDQAVTEGSISAEKATEEWSASLQDAQGSIDKLTVSQEQANKEAKELARTLETELKQKAKAAAEEARRLQQALEADKKAMNEARIAGGEMAGMFDHVSKNTNRANQSLRISQERAVMMGQVVGGLTAQMIAGADGTQLWASGLTHLAMIMSTAGPWGMAAGAAVTILTGLTTGLMKANEESKKAAAEGFQELQDSIEATNDQLREIWGEENAAAMAKHKRGIDDISQSWEKSLEASRKYYREQDARADAELGLKQSELELEKQQKLQATSDPIERDRIEESYREKEREAKFNSELAKNERRRKELQEEKSRAELTEKEAGAQIKQLEDDIVETEKARRMDHPEYVESDQRSILRQYREALEAAKGGDEEASRRVQGLAPEIGPARDVIDADRETYGKGRELTPAEQKSVDDFLARQKQDDSSLASMREDLRKQKKLRDDSYSTARDRGSELGRLDLNDQELRNREVYGSRETQLRMNEIEGRRRERDDALPPQSLQQSKLDERLRGVTDPQQRANIELDFNKEAEQRTAQEALGKNIGRELQGAETRKKVGDADLAEKTQALADAAEANTDAQKKNKEELQRAAEAFKDGASTDEVARSARLFQETAKVQSENLQSLAKSAEAALDLAKRNSQAIAALETKAQTARATGVP